MHQSKQRLPGEGQMKHTKIFVIFLVLAVYCITGCGPSKQETEAALEAAHKEYTVLKKDNASSAESLLTRTLLRKAENKSLARRGSIGAKLNGCRAFFPRFR